MAAASTHAAPLRGTPTRSCVACRTVRPKSDLRRIVRLSDGAVTIDASGRMPGRGAYVCLSGDCLAIALGKGSLGRSLKTTIPVATRDALLATSPSPDMTIQGGASGQE